LVFPHSQKCGEDIGNPIQEEKMMGGLSQATRIGILVVLVAACDSNTFAQPATGESPRTGNPGASKAAAGAARYMKAFVVDDRLSALRRGPSVQSEVIRRLRLGHTVFIIGTGKSKAGRPGFRRVAVTRRTRGWIHESSLALQDRAGEDQRIMKLIEASTDGVDRITLCRTIIARFSRSHLVPRAMLTLGEEAERAAETLSQRTRRRLAEVRGVDASLRDYYLSDAGLDRYSRLGIVFDFDETNVQLIYDGRAYREIIRRFPKAEESRLARQRLELLDQKPARQQ
jgi:hypothetical protein